MDVKYKAALAAVLFVLCASVSPARAEESRTTLWFAPSSDVIQGATLIDQGRISEGMAILKAAMAEEDLTMRDYASALTNLCAGYLGLKLYREAVKNCDMALRIRPSLWQALNNRAAAYFGLADYGAAVKDFEAAIKLRPSMDTLRYNLSLAEQRLKMGGVPEVREWDG